MKGLLTKLNLRRRLGFTLAEVLITLGVIGIVAAMTIPTLINNYQKKQLVAGLQKGYSTMSNVFKMAMADDVVDNISNTTLWKALPEGSISQGNFAALDYSGFIAVLNKYFKVQKYCNPYDDTCFNIKYKMIDGSDEYGDSGYNREDRLKVYGADGLVYFLRFNAGRGVENWGDFNSNFLGYIGIDVNGDNPPNQNGRDYHDVALFANGEIIFPGSQRWQNSWGGDSWKDTCVEPFGNSSYPGDYCGARIFEEGWRMDY